LPGAAPPANSLIALEKHKYGSRCVLAHFGTLTSSRSLVYFLKAFNTWALKNPAASLDCEIHIYGSHLDKRSIDWLARSEATFIRSQVICHGRLEHDPISGLTGREQVAGHMKRADCLLLTHGDGDECSAYIPSKFYEYLHAKRPQLTMIHNNQQLLQLAQTRGFYISKSTDIESIYRQIERIYSDWRTKELSATNAQNYAPIGVQSCLDSVLDELTDLRSTKSTLNSANASS
jgi:hypothetical protein